MTREKRTAQLRINVPESTRQKVERLVAESGNVLSMSDYLYEVVEQHIEVIEIQRKKIGAIRARQ